MTWSVHDAGSYGLATTDAPADMAAALALPASWPIDKSRAYVRRDQWENLTPTPPPTLTAISPNTGPTAGGTPVVVDGTDLLGATGLTIAGAACTGFQVASASNVVAVTPAGVAGARNVILQHPLGNVSRSGWFTYADEA